MPCDKVKSEKYLKRKSPPYHANDCPNQEKKGNDGNIYISKKDKNGIYKWILKDPFEPKIEPKKGRIVNYDGFSYYAVEGKDKKYYWKKKEIKYKSTPEAYYKQFPDYQKSIYDYKEILNTIQKLKKDLKKINIILIFVKWNPSSIYGIDYELGLDMLYDKYNNIDGGLEYIIITEVDIYIKSKIKDSYIPVMHNIFNSSKDKFNQVFTKYFPNRTVGFSNQKDKYQLLKAPLL